MKTIFSLLALCCAMTISISAVSSEDSDSNVTSIKDYVRQVFIRGVPYEETRKLDPSAVPMLLDMLNNPMEEAHWANIVVVLEIIGNEDVVEPLIEFIERDPGGVLSRDNYTAKTSALMGMGYLINRTGSKEALNYLIGGTGPQQWEAKQVAGIVDYHASVEERNQDMSKYSMLGLALSGHPAAEKVLRGLHQQSMAAGQAKSASQLKIGNMLSDAMSAHTKIAKKGLVDYYQSEK